MGRSLSGFFVSILLFAAISATAQPIVIDGQFTAAEWAAATNYSFSVNLPGGGTTSGQLYIANDRDNLYVCMRVQEPVTYAAESFVIEFDSPARDGVIGAGDDGLVLSISGFCNRQKTFTDDFRYTGIPPCPPATICSGRDVDFGGTSDGNGAVDNDGTWTTYELWHPLASADVTHDIQFRRRRDELQFTVMQRLIDATNTIADTFYPGPGFGALATYVIHP
ncbi:MAG TPA: hypothetical protein VII12_14500 [Thermoanaerobaculia bacterium]